MTAMSSVGISVETTDDAELDAFVLEPDWPAAWLVSVHDHGPLALFAPIQRVRRDVVDEFDIN